MKRAQVSVEYLLVMGFAFFIIFPLIYLFVSQSQAIEEQIIATQVHQIGNKIVQKGEEMYYKGYPSKTTIRVYMPQRVSNLTFSNKWIMIEYQNANSLKVQMPFSTAINMTGTGDVSPRAGVHYIEIASQQGGYVSVKDV